MTGAGAVDVGDVELWVEQRGDGPDVLLLAGLSDPAEAWTFQLDGLADQLPAHRLRQPGRRPLAHCRPTGSPSTDMADDAAALLRALGIERAHVAGFSGGSATAQELALRHPELVRSLVLVSTWARPDAVLPHDGSTRGAGWPTPRRASGRCSRRSSCGSTPRGPTRTAWSTQIIDEALAFPHPQSPEGFLRQLDAWAAPRHARPARRRSPCRRWCVAGELDIVTPPRLGRAVAERIPGAEFVVLPGEAHQPFQESPEEFNTMVDSFWRRVDAAR